MSEDDKMRMEMENGYTRFDSWCWVLKFLERLQKNEMEGTMEAELDEALLELDRAVGLCNGVIDHHEQCAYLIWEHRTSVSSIASTVHVIRQHRASHVNLLPT